VQCLLAGVSLHGPLYPPDRLGPGNFTRQAPGALSFVQARDVPVCGILPSRHDLISGARCRPVAADLTTWPVPRWNAAIPAGGSVRKGSLRVLAGVLFAGMLSGQTVTLYTQFQQPPSKLSVQTMKAELGRIMTPLRLHLQWRPLEQATGQGSSAEVVVVHFAGHCQGTELEVDDTRDGPLGWTPVSHGEVLPFSHVDCDRIRGVLSDPLAAAGPGEREHLLGRAMARVLAHEMYHVLTNSTQHATRGVAKAAYSSTELISEGFTFEPRP
jgi:hypothetical protein